MRKFTKKQAVLENEAAPVQGQFICVVDGNPGDCLNKGSMDMKGPKEVILDFLRILEGSQTRLKELHWDAERKSKHELADSIRETLDKVQDQIAEDMMGYLGIRIKVGDLVPITCEDCRTIEDVARFVEEAAITLKVSVEGIRECAGIGSILDDLVHDLNSSLYLDDLK